jgi:hypothetical protein
MVAVDLILAGWQAHRAWKQVQSYAQKRALMVRSVSRDILALHEAEVGARPADPDQVAILVMACAGQHRRRDPTVEVEDLRRLRIWGGWNIVVAETVELWNWRRQRVGQLGVLTLS